MKFIPHLYTRFLYGISFKLCILIALFINSQHASGQCFFEGPFHIADLSSNYIVLDIEGALNDSLSDPNQGVCAINLHFEHSTVGDLMIFLTSPAGEQIILVGATTAPPPLTDFTNWNISFLPCATPPTPDPGFNPQWSNAQNWSFIGSYTGSYHPFSGCLEDFNSGPVNGSWTLFIQDGIEFDEGELLGFSIIFCDPSGIDCETCLPDGGILNSLPIHICQGSTLNEFPDPVYLVGGPPPEDDYFYNFLLTKEDTVVAVLPDSTYIFDQPDTFRLYGISLLKSDSNTLDSLVGKMSLSELIEALEPNPGLFCGDIAMRWVDIIVHPTFEYAIDTTLCFNGFLTLGDTVLNEPGMHSILLQTNSGCDSLVHINLSIDSSLIAIGHALDTFTCRVDSVTIDGSMSVLTPNAQWYWEDPNGIAIGDSNSISVKVGYPGIYTLIVYDEQCTVANEIEVLGHLNGIPVEISGSDLGCAIDTSDFRLASYEYLISFEWTDPAGVKTMDSIVKVTEPGWLFFYALDTDSCAVNDSVFVNKDLSGPNILSDTILGNCKRDTINLIPVPNDPSWQIIWVFEGDTLPGTNPAVNFSGVFELVITDTLGCVSRDSIYVGYTYSEPTVSMATAPLGCNEASVPILASTGIGGSQYYWQGPNSFEEFVQGIDAPLPGEYFLTVTTPAGCTADTVITVISEGNLPSWEINLSDTTGCLLDSTQILLNVGFSNMTFEWSGPGSFYSEMQSPFVSLEGWYYVDMTTRGGCSITDSIRVTNDFEVNDIIIFSDTLNCLQPEGYLWVDGPEGYIYQWTTGAADPVESDSVLFSHSQLYTLQVINPDNGCSVFFEQMTEADFTLPSATLSSETINCNMPDAFIYIEDGQYADFWHSSPFVIAESDSGVWVDRSGIYILYFESENGCIDSFQIEVLADTLGPDVSILGEDLGCGRDSVILSFQTSSILENFEWSGPAGFTSNDSTIVVYNAGEFSLLADGANGCTSERTFVVEDNSDFIEFNFSPSQELNCSHSLVPISIESPLAEYQYNWIGPGGMVITGDTITVSESGWYFLTVTDNSNCTGIDSIEILYDFDVPEVEIMHSDFNCIDTIIEMQAIGSEEYAFHWTGPEGFSSDSSSVFIHRPGQYFLEVTGANGCQLDTAIHIIADTIPPDAVIEGGGTLNCVTSAIQLQSGLDAMEVSYSWLRPDGIIEEGIQTEADIGGRFYLIATGENGCLSLDSVDIGTDYNVPGGFIMQSDYDCLTETIQLYIENSQDLDSVSWTLPDGSLLFSEEIQTSQEGIHYALLTGANGCDTVINTEVIIEKVLPIYTVEVSDINCIDTEAEIRFISNENIEVLIAGPGSFESSDLITHTSLGGDYYAVITGENGCRDSVFFRVETDTIPPLVEVELTRAPDCFENTAEFSAVIPGEPENFSVLWSSSTGLILTNPELQTITAGAAGMYRAEVLDQRNGCRGTATYQLESINDSIGPIELDLTMPDCLENDLGRVEVLSVSGDIKLPLEYSISGGEWQSNPTFFLQAGEYTLSIRDSIGCSTQTQLTIDDIPSFSVDLGVDLLIELGQTIELRPEIDPQAGNYQFLWTPNVNCTHCRDVEVSPLENSTYGLWVTDLETGCQNYDKITVEVTTDPRVYIPNVFYPGSSVGNSIFRAYSNSEFIRDLTISIYTRWGNEVFHIQNCEDLENCFWDGTSNGSDLQPGVYVYRIIITSITGEEIHRIGEIQLLR